MPGPPGLDFPAAEKGRLDILGSGAMCGGDLKPGVGGSPFQAGRCSEDVEGTGTQKKGAARWKDR